MDFFFVFKMIQHSFSKCVILLCRGDEVMAPELSLVPREHVSLYLAVPLVQAPQL